MISNQDGEDGGELTGEQEVDTGEHRVMANEHRVTTGEHRSGHG